LRDRGQADGVSLDGVGPDGVGRAALAHPDASLVMITSVAICITPVTPAV
jgi:hypothetical protein